MGKGDWATALLHELGAPVTPQNVAFIAAWMDRENTYAKWNPMATTQKEQGSTYFNHLGGSTGVQNYVDEQSGLKAEAHTLANGHYDTILSGIMHNDQNLALGAKSEWRTYAGNSDYSEGVRTGMANYLAHPELLSHDFRAEGAGGTHVDLAFTSATSNAPMPLPPPVLYDAHSPDSDHDGLTDAFELAHHLNPHSADTDHDGLSDAYEIAHGLNPLSADTDHDGIRDGVEVALHSDPLHGGDLAHDGTPLLDHLVGHGGPDSDGDGLSDKLELLLHTNPHSADTDRDGFTDAYEHLHGSNPLDPHSTPIDLTHGHDFLVSDTHDPHAGQDPAHLVGDHIGHHP